MLLQAKLQPEDETFAYIAAIAICIGILLLSKSLLISLFAVFNYVLFKHTGLVFTLRKPFFYKEMPLTHQTLLQRKMPFFNTLDHSEKRLFCHRTSRFMEKKSFLGREGIDITEDMQLLVSAAAVRLTFGYGKYMLPDFGTIIIYPHSYYSNYTGTFNKGETNMKGVVVVSWDNFVEGFADDKDRINLGYHEFAHALYMQMHKDDIKTDPRLFLYGNQLRDAFNQQDYIYREAQASGIIREYAFTNFMEFFAVSSEVFFEQPEQMRQRCPVLYNMLVELFGYRIFPAYTLN